MSRQPCSSERKILSFFQQVEWEGPQRGQRSLLEMQEYLRPLIAERRREP